MAAGCLVTEGLFLIPFFRVCGLIAEKFQLFKGRFAFQHELLPQLAQAHGIAQLAVRDCAVDKIRCKGKIAVICPVANDDISRLIVEVKSVYQVFFGFCGQRGRSIEFAVLQKNRQPMQHRVTGSVQIQNGQTVAFDFIPVSVAIVVDANAPLFGHVGVLSAVKADAIVIVGLAIAELWLFNNMIRTVINCFFHRTTSSL